MEGKEIYSPMELSRRWGVCRTTVYNMIRRGDIPFIRLSERRVIIPAEAIRKWENDNAAKSS